jgi:hypothetical protein
VHETVVNAVIVIKKAENRLETQLGTSQGDLTMTTNTSTHPNETQASIPVALKSHSAILSSAMIVLLFILIAGFAVVATQLTAIETTDKGLVLEAWSARYQGQADLYAAKEAARQRSFEAQTARYQGQADLALARQRRIEAWAARYQGQADLITGRQRSLEAWTARYQGMVELYAPVLQRGRQAWSARYQGLADYYAAKEAARLEAWSARYRGQAKLFSEQK